MSASRQQQPFAHRMLCSTGARCSAAKFASSTAPRSSMLCLPDLTASAVNQAIEEHDRIERKAFPPKNTNADRREIEAHFLDDFAVLEVWAVRANFILRPLLAACDP